MTESMTPEDEIATLIKRSREAQKQIENYSTIDVYDIDTGKKTKYLKIGVIYIQSFRTL